MAYYTRSRCKASLAAAEPEPYPDIDDLAPSDDREYQQAAIDEEDAKQQEREAQEEEHDGEYYYASQETNTSSSSQSDYLPSSQGSVDDDSEEQTLDKTSKIAGAERVYNPYSVSVQDDEYDDEDGESEDES